ncbi:MAG: glycosyltransferase family 2 protein [Acidimicrobiales bacterium]
MNEQTDAARPESPEPVVTIVVTPRERFGLSQASLESIYANTTVDFRLVYVDGNAPSRTGNYLRSTAAERGFELISSPEYLSPNRARNLGLAGVTTPFVVFVDNDLVVAKGWLRRLLACAEETGAAIVGPLYMEGDPGQDIVHMAGGDYTLDGETGKRRFTTVHRLQGQRLDEIGTELVREPVGFVEFHCLLARTDFVRSIGGFDEALLSTREHLDLCLIASERSEQVYFEPSSRVTYLTPPPIDRADLSFFLRRWSEQWNEASLEHFCAKYGIAPSYRDRMVGMRARRQLVLRPVGAASAKLLPGPVDRFAMRVMARLEREINRALFRVPGYAR